METVVKTLNYTELANGISSWLKEYAQKSGQRGFVMGVSGGIDSAVVSTLCARTGLPLLILEMPIHQGQDQVTRAKNHIKWLKASFPNVESKEIDLTDAYDILYEDFSKGEPPFGRQIMQEDYDFSMANTRSRLRMVTLYQHAGMYRMLVAGTGNKVEDFGIGFYTKYGDGGVDISPIGDLMKSEVYALGAELGVGNDILTAAPTDGLHADGRTDEDQIGATYDELEWAMNWIEDHTNVEQGVGAYYVDSDDQTLTERQIEVLKIYRRFNSSNKHKMETIPVFDSSKYRTNG
jgi:NAD+ synthase